MPTSRKQQQAAGVELSKRRSKRVKKQHKGKATRPFGDASMRLLKDIASGPIKKRNR